MSFMPSLGRSEKVSARHASEPELIPELPSHIYLSGILACKSDLYWTWCPSFGVYPSSRRRAVRHNANDSQTAKAVRADQNTLSEMFERIEAFFQRLDVYTEVAPNQGMVNTITGIMVEVLNFIGIATKEMKQGRTSKLLLFKQIPADNAIAEKYLKKLMGKTDIENALKRLDRLTQEEAQMASAQLLQITNAIDNEVRGIVDGVLVVDSRVAGVDNRVAGMGDRVAGVDERVAGVDERVAGVDEH